jgi:DnaJ domain
VSQDQSSPPSNNSEPLAPKTFEATHYGLLGLHPSASVRDIRQAYRELSKLYHPDTTQLVAATATVKFQQLNEAYATLSSPERRLAYDQKIGYSRVTVVRTLPSLSQPQPYQPTSSAYLDATDRPLSAGELFALFILGVTFVGCLILAITIGFTKGEATFQSVAMQPTAAISLPETSAVPLLLSPPAAKAPQVLADKAGKLKELRSAIAPMIWSVIMDSQPDLNPVATQAADRLEKPASSHQEPNVPGAGAP